MTLFSGRPVEIIGTGIYIPERVMTNVDFEKIIDTNDKWILERTGIRERHFAAADEKCSDLAYYAALEALKDAGIKPEDIDMVLVGTNSPDTIFPSVSCKVQGRIGAVRAGAIDIQAGCTGSLAALSVGISGIASGIWNKVLVIGAESFNDIIDWTDRSTCILFGDGAGACVLSVSDGKSRFTATRLLADGTKSDLIELEKNEDGTRELLRMKGNEVFKFVNTELPKFIKGLCKDAEITPEQVDFWIFHQANLRIIEGVFRRLHIPIEKTLMNLEKYGNTSAASLLITLHEAMKSGCVNSGDTIGFAAFGTGMTFGALLYEA